MFIFFLQEEHFDTNPQHPAVHPQIMNISLYPVRAPLICLFKKPLQNTLIVIQHIIPDSFAQFFCIRYIQACQTIPLLIDPNNLYLIMIYIIDRRSSQNTVHHRIRKHVAVHQFTDMKSFHLFSMQARKIKVPFICQSPFKLVNRQRLIIIIPLHIPASHTAQHIFLLKGFHPFHDDRQSHKPCHIDNRL